MCKRGDMVSVPQSDLPAYAGNDDMVLIDRCITPMVLALNRAGIVTISSCCGHGEGPGEIMLADGRKLSIDEVVRPALEVP